MRWWIRPKATSGFEDVLARCLAAIDAGEASVESCLAQYPAHAARLGPALRAAGVVRASLAARPDPAFVARARQRVLAAAGESRPTAVVAARAPAASRRLRPAFAAVVVALVLSAVSVPMMAVASAGALPGDRLYGAKLFFEEVQLSLSLSEEARARQQLERAEERANEIRELAERGRVERIPTAAEAYQDQLSKAREPIDRGTAQPELVARIEASVQRQEDTIRAALDRLSDSPAMARATPSATASPEPAASATAGAATAEPSATLTPEVEPSPGATATPTAAPPSATATPPSRTATPVVATPTASAQQAAAQQAAQQALQDAANARSAANAAAARAAQTAIPSVNPATARPATATTTATTTPVPPLTPSTEPPVVVTPVQTPAAQSATATPVPPLTPVDTGASSPTATSTAPVVRPLDPATATATATALPQPTPATPRPTAVAPLPTLPPTATATPRPLSTPTPAPVTPTPEPPRATIPPTPTETATPAEPPRATVTLPTATPLTPGVRVGQATAAVPATPTPVPPLLRPVTLPAGRSTFLYVGASLPVDEALAPLTGKYQFVEWKPATSPVVLQYRPGVSTNRPVLTTGSIVVIHLTEAVTVGPNTLVQLEP